MKSALAIAALLLFTTLESVRAQSQAAELTLEDLPADLVELHEGRPDACDPFGRIPADL